MRHMDGRPRAAFIVNPSKIDVGHLRELAHHEETQRSWLESLWSETAPDGSPAEQVAAAIAAGATLVVAAGGDGTVRQVAEAMWRRGAEVPLAIIPAGTGNLLARNLRIDTSSLRLAVETVFAGRNREIDLGVVDVERPDGSREHTVFTVLCGLGLDAEMIAHTDEQLKDLVGWPAYVVGIGHSLASARRVPLRYRVDNGPVKSTRAHTVLIGNCGLLPWNVSLLPHAEIDDGELDIAVIRPRGRFGWVPIWARIAAQSATMRVRRDRGWNSLHLPDGKIDTLSYRRGKEVVLRCSAEPEHFEVDGDPLGQIVAARARVEPGALTVRVPITGEPLPVLRRVAGPLPRGGWMPRLATQRRSRSARRAPH